MPQRAHRYSSAGPLADDPVILTCAISGALASREQCPAIPYTPAEYAAEARRIVDEGVSDLRGLMFQVGAAAMQVAAAGHTDEARKILADTRRALYKILAEDEPTEV